MAKLYLSHWSDPQKVFVPEEIHVKLKQYHFSMVRSLYRCIQKKYSGGILNYDEGINIPLAFRALWQALIAGKQIKLPILVIASDNSVVEWHYHLSQLGEITILNSQNCESVLQNSNFSIILVSQCNLKLLQPYRENEFSFVVIEDFDLIATKVLFKKLSGEFNVALTKRNFMSDREYKVLWHILNWVSPGEFGKLNDFADFDLDHLENLRNPYDEIWYSYNYQVGDYNFDDEEDEKKEYQETLKEWANQNNLPFGNTTEQKTRKRRANCFSDIAIKKKTRSAISNDEVYEVNYHESKTQPAEEVINVKGKNVVIEDFCEVKGIRDVSDLNYSKLIREELEMDSQRESDERSSAKPLSFKSKSLNMKRKTFKFLDEKRNRGVDKELKQTEDHKIVKSRSDCGNERADSATKTLTHVEGATTNACQGAVFGNRKVADVCESLKETNTKASVMRKYTTLSVESERANVKMTKEVSKQGKDSSFLLRNQVIYKDASASVEVPKQIFPSLEDILTFKKRDIADLLFIRRHATTPIKESAIGKHGSKSILEQKSFGCNLERQGMASLEEVFKCKRTLNGMPGIIKKLEADYHLVGANHNNMSTRFILQDNLKMKLCKPHGIIYKDSPISNSRCEGVTLLNKATQTSNVMTTPVACKSLNISHKKTVLTPDFDTGNGHFNEKSEVVDECKNASLSEENLEVKTFEASSEDERRSSSVESNQEITKRTSALLNQGGSLKNPVNLDVIEDKEDEELLLSIVEGRFVSRQPNKVDHVHHKDKCLNNENVAEDDGSTKTFKRYSSRTLLGSLFGDEAECLAEKVEENHTYKNKSSDGEEMLPAVAVLKSNSQSYNHLKVRTIDQINGEKPSVKSNADVYDSLKCLFSADTEDESSNTLSGHKNYGIGHYSRHNFSSLFG